MKKLMIGLLTLTSLSAFAGNINDITNGGHYMTYSNYCDYEAEKDGTTLYLTAIRNSYQNMACDDSGKVETYECGNYQNSDCRNSSGVTVRILSDGNFIQYGRTTIKFLLTH